MCRGGMLGCCCGFRVIKCLKQSFWMFLSENSSPKRNLRVCSGQMRPLRTEGSNWQEGGREMKGQYSHICLCK